MDSIQIQQITVLAGIDGLVAASKEEGFHFLERLVREWDEGVNRFGSPGEVLFGVYVDSGLIATGGLTHQGPSLGRVRRVYVHPKWRKQGIATALMKHVLTFAQEHYKSVVLYTDTQNAAQFYEGLGFVPESPEGPDHATHRLAFPIKG